LKVCTPFQAEYMCGCTTPVLSARPTVSASQSTPSGSISVLGGGSIGTATEPALPPLPAPGIAGLPPPSPEAPLAPLPAPEPTPVPLPPPPLSPGPPEAPGPPPLEPPCVESPSPPESSSAGELQPDRAITATTAPSVHPTA
jgi:hypothetical protein